MRSFECNIDRNWMPEGGDRERMTSNHEAYLLMASTQGEVEDWVRSIHRVIWAPFGGGIFGQKLEETIRYERRYGNKMAPMLVEQCVDFIRCRGLREEGLFHLPGQANLLQELQEAFDCGEKPPFDCNTDVHTVASLLKLYLRELPEPVVPFCKYHEFLSCIKLFSKERDTGMKELRRQVQDLPAVNYNLLQYICRFLDEVQSYSEVNKMSVQNLATVFGPNILRPKVEDPLNIMEGTVLVQQLMEVLIGQHDVLFPPDQDHTSTLQLVNNNETHKQLTNGPLQNTENNTRVMRQRVWDMPDSPTRFLLDNSSSQSESPRNRFNGQRFEVTCSPLLAMKKNPVFIKGSGIVTNGSFSSCLSSSSEASQPNTGTLQARWTAAMKISGTKMAVQNGVMRLGVSSADETTGTLNDRNRLWTPNSHVTMREGKTRDAEHQQNRLSTYDNVHTQQQTTQQQTQASLSSSCEDKQSEDRATWSTSSCEISLPENSTSCRSSITTCPEQDVFGNNFEGSLLDGPVQEENGLLTDDMEQRTSNGASQGIGETSSSDNSDTLLVITNGPTNHITLHSLVTSLKQEVIKQKNDYEARIKSLEHQNLKLEAMMVKLHEELNQEKKKFTMVEIKLRNAEKAKDDAEKRNEMLQKEMEDFFSTFGDLTADP